MNKKELNITNKKAHFDFKILHKYTAGMQLTGTEVKSVRAGNVNLSDAYCFFKLNKQTQTEELFVKGINIGTFKQGSYANHQPERLRKLLLKASELRKLKSKSTEKGLTIIPLRIFESETGYLKLEIAIAQGKKAYDKRESIKERDIARNMQRG
jgi:SsrA-binding protein